MGRRFLPQTLAAACALVAWTGANAVAPAAAAQTASRPNIILVMTDDQRSDTLWAMPTVQRELVQKGVRFSNAFVVNSMCCPSRASILTGQYSHTTGVYRNHGSYGGFSAFRDTSTVATWLASAGYRTGFVGKYINGYIGTTYVPPGWDRWVAYTGGYYDYSLNVDGVFTPYGSEPADYSTDVLARHAVSFIEETTSRFPTTPLFLVFSPFAPHWQPQAQHPVAAPRHVGAFADLPPWRPASYDEEDVTDKPAWLRSRPRLTDGRRSRIDGGRRAEFAALLAVDDAVGQILETLERAGRLENTLLVFTSDNGFAWGEHRHWGKQVPYEETIRVPLVVRYDALLATPRADRRLVLNIDLAPTFAEVAGVSPALVDGMSLRPLLEQDVTPWRTDFLIEHLRYAARSRLPTYCGIRTRRHLYVEYESGEKELYDLVLDPGELENIARNPAFASRRAALSTRLAELCRPRPPLLCTRTGTTGDDERLAGTNQYDVLCALAGNDAMDARGGNDRAFGGSGDDVVSGGAGNDIVFAGAGNDAVFAGRGRDVVRGGKGRDQLFGGGHGDVIGARDGSSDLVSAGPGPDRVLTRDGVRDFVACGPGVDFVVADKVDLLAGCERARVR